MRFLVSVCKSDTCTDRGSDELFFELLSQVKQKGFAEDDVKVQRGGCYGLCKLGPNIIVRDGAAALRVLNDPFGGDCTYRAVAGEFHYAALTIEEIEQLVTEHLGEEQPVREFLERLARRVGSHADGTINDVD